LVTWAVANKINSCSLRILYYDFLALKCIEHDNETLDSFAAPSFLTPLLPLPWYIGS